MSFLLKQTGIFAGALGVTIAILIGAKSVGYDSNPKTSSNSDKPDIQLTKQEKFLQNLMSISKADVNGYINLKTENFENAYDVYLDASADLSDLEDIKLNGNINTNIDGLTLGGDFGYYENTAYLAIDTKNKFSISVDSITEFIDKLPNVYGIELNLPEELVNLNLDSIQAQIQDMEYVETPAGDRYFILELLEGLKLHLKTDNEYNCKGVRTDSIFFEGIYIKLDIDIEYVSETKYVLEAPDKSQYQDVRPAFTLVDNLFNLGQGQQLGFELEVNVNRLNEEKENEKFIESKMYLGLDMENKEYFVEGSLEQSFVAAERKLDIAVGLIDDTIYSKLGNLKVSISNSTIGTLINYVITKINDDTTGQLMDKLSEILASADLESLLEKANNVLGQITTNNDNISIELNLDAFTEELSPILIKISFAEEGNPNSFAQLEITGFSFGDYSGSLSLKTVPFKTTTIVKSEYVAIDPAFRLVNAVEELLVRDDFRIEMTGAISDAAGVKDDITIDGGFQFNLPEEFGYGDITIIDDNKYTHNIRADKRAGTNEIIASYNNTMNVKFNTDTLMDMMDLIMNVIENPDDHFMQLFGDLINSFKDGVIGKILDGDYGALLAMHFINNFSVTESKISMDIDLSPIGFEATMGFELRYSDILVDGVPCSSVLNGITIKNCTVGNTTINMEINLEEFDGSLETSRLDFSKEYMDFSDIKVLLELGINTSKYNYYHFNSSVALNIKAGLLGLIKINLEFNVDLKIRVSPDGGVQIAAEFTNVPVPLSIGNQEGYDSTEDGTRNSSLYYDDGMFYTRRSEVVRKKRDFVGLFYNRYNYTQVRRFETDYFLDHILEIFLTDLLGLKSSLFDGLNSDELTDSINLDKICYERILKTFTYSEPNNLFYFGISLKALLGMDESSTMFSDLNLTVNKKPGSSELDGLHINTSLNLLIIKASVSLDFTLCDDGEITLTDASKLTRLEEMVALYGGVEMNKLHVSATKIS